MLMCEEPLIESYVVLKYRASANLRSFVVGVVCLEERDQVGIYLPSASETGTGWNALAELLPTQAVVVSQDAHVFHKEE